MIKSELKSNFVKLLSGYLGAQLISLAFYPLLTRIFKPQSFGVFGIFNSCVQLLSIFATGQFHFGILSQRDDQGIRKLFSLSIILNSISSITILCVCVCLYAWGELDGIYLLIPLSVFFYGINEINKNWFVVRNLLGKKGFYVNANRLSSNVFKLLGSSPWTLVLSEICANLLGNILFFKHSLKDLEIWGTVKKVKEIVLENKQYPLFFTFYVLSQVLSSEAVTLYLKNFLSEHELGIFFISNKLFIQSALMISTSLSLAFNNLLVHEMEKRRIVCQSAFKFFAVGVALAFMLSLPDYTGEVEFFFGKNWGDLSSVIGFFLFLSPVKILSGFFAHILVLSQHLKFIAFFKVFQFLILIIMLQTGFSNLTDFLWIFVPFEILFDSVFIFWGYWLIRRVR